jgi:long-chain-acyl-CoA dehydrogenase
VNESPASGPKVTTPDELSAVRERVRAFVEAEVLPHFTEWEASGALPATLFRRCGETGLLGLGAPAELGGEQRDFLALAALADEMMRHNVAGVSCSLLIQAATVCSLIVRYGSRPLQSRLLPPIITGQCVTGLAITEPAGGSALMHSVRCVAESDGESWVITGEKLFITNGPIADLLVVLARTDTAPGPFSMTLMAVPTDAQGFQVVEELDKLGLRSSPTGWLRFDRCRVPKVNTIGEVGRGYLHASDGLSEERLLIAIGAVSLAQSCLDETIRFLQRRSSAGRPLTARQAIRFELAEMAAELMAMRSFVWGVAADVARGTRALDGTCIAKFAVCERAQRIVSRCGHLHGSAGLCEGTSIERAVRDARVLSIFGGTSETMREIFAAKVFLSAGAASGRRQEVYA